MTQHRTRLIIARVAAMVLLIQALSGCQKPRDPGFVGAWLDYTPNMSGTIYLPSPTGLFGVGTDGKGWLHRGNGGERFALPLASGQVIYRIFFDDYQGDPLFVYECGEFDGGIGHVVRLDKVSLSVEWRADIPGGNIMEPLLRGHFLYVTGIGTVGKIDVRTGVYVWQIKGLYRMVRTHGAYNAFDKPILKGRTVIFPESSIDVEKGQAASLLKLIVDDRTGTVIAGTVPPQER